MPVYEYLKGGKTHYFYQFEVKTALGDWKPIKKRGFKTEGEAKKAERRAMVAWENEEYVEPSKVKFGDFVMEWLKKKRNLSEETKHTNLSYAKNHIVPTLGKYALQQITVRHIEAFLSSLYESERNLAESTVSKIYNIARSAMLSAKKKELIKSDPFEKIETHEKPKIEYQNVNFWNRDEARTFLSEYAGPERYRLIYYLAIYCGMRQGEILGLKWENIDMKNKKIRVIARLARLSKKVKDGAKTRSGVRVIAFSDTLIGEINRHKKMMTEEQRVIGYKPKDGLVFLSSKGNPLDPSQVRKSFVREAEKLGLKQIRFHDLRHTCASLYLSINTNVKIVQEMLGHSSIQVTYDTYSHLIPDMQDEAAANLDNHLNLDE